MLPDDDLDLPYDQEVTDADIQALSSPDEIARFFTKLRYRTEARVSQTREAMGMTSANLRDTIRSIERIARHEDEFGAFEVYLLQLTSLTISLRNEIAQKFRNLDGDYLLVLTDDYARLDFVLLERVAPTVTTQEQTIQIPPLPGIRSTIIRPHVFQVERLKPNAVARRVLSRFTYTEVDTLAQQEKLLNAYIVATWSTPFFNNRALFSDYYLNQRLPERAEWHTDEKTTMRRASRDLRGLYEDAREQFRGISIVPLREKLFEPVMRVLSFAFQSVKMPESQSAVYRLYPAPDAKGKADRTKPPLALCLTYPWGRNLDGRDEQRDNPTADEIPGAVVVTLLDASQAAWAILTNGITWRLYAASAHSRATNYYEINLQETLEMEPDLRETAFRYFWLLFHAKAFISSERQVAGETRTINLLDEIMLESERYARAVGNRLKERVFEKIFPHFAAGFVAHARQHALLPANMETLPDDERNRLLEPYFTGTLTFLYRLLFLLYAESRDLLPVRQERGYFAHSLERMKYEIAADAGEIEDEVERRLASYSERATTLYERLQMLFAAVDKGRAELNVPIYNGGLFMTEPPAPAQNEAQEVTVARFLRDYKIPDRYLALGLDLMARDLDEEHEQRRLTAGDVNGYPHKLVPIDYKSLGVRHLGSIYEGLLEFKLHMAAEQMAVVPGKRTDEIIALREARRLNIRPRRERQGGELRDRLYQPGDIYLENDRHERKATGSYYTPDYVVKYIVEQTVGPLLKKKMSDLRVVFRRSEDQLREEREKARVKHGTEADAQLGAYKVYRVTLNEAFFDLKVLDPAMGSGHFLVEAVDYITDRMSEFLNGFKWNAIVYELNETRKKIEASMKQQGVTIEVQRLTDLNLLKRRVLKSCIYGVDLNPMAVELAKVSLWLDSFTLGAPLSFLDHHIKCGNSLIGADLQEAQQALTGGIFGWKFDGLLDATQIIRESNKITDSTADEVKKSQEAYQQARDLLAPYKRVLDVWLSEYFGNKNARRIAGDYANLIIGGKDSEIDKNDYTVIKRAMPLTTEKRFFHWELEFPEVYFDETERKPDGGFDAVIGNPPYVRQEGLGDDKPAFKELYKVYDSIADLYTYFIERGHLMLRSGGRFGMITANKFMRANYGAALRRYMTEHIYLESLIDFGDLPVFEEATAYPVIVLSNKATRNGMAISYASIKDLSAASRDLPATIQMVASVLPDSAFSGTNWSLASASAQVILQKMRAQSVTLGDYVGGKVRRGILTGFNEAFVIDSATRDLLIEQDAHSNEIIKPFLIGEDVKRYDISFEERYLIFTRRGIKIEQYKAIYEYLLQYKTLLEPRPVDWNEKVNGEWPGRKLGSYKWYEIQDNIAYYAEFEKPKIIYPNICVKPEFAYDENAYYSNQKTFIIPLADLYLLAVLNSEAMHFIFDATLPKLRGGYFEPSYVFMKDVPIPRCKTSTPQQERAQALEEAKVLYLAYLRTGATGEMQDVLDFVTQCLAQQPEQSDIVHDLLAFLAQEMLYLNQQKRAEQQRFLDWLVATLGVLPTKEGKQGLEALTGKSKLQEYVGDYQKGEDALDFDALWEIVRKNRTHLGPNFRLHEQRVRDEYQRSLAIVQPLKTCLQRTDELIDQIVYRLYGLTPEEIAIVEGQ